MYATCFYNQNSRTVPPQEYPTPKPASKILPDALP